MALLTAAVVVEEPLQSGATRAQVVSALGEPAGAITAGTREILSYAEGKVVVDRGYLVRATFDLDETKAKAGS